MEKKKSFVSQVFGLFTKISTSKKALTQMAITLGKRALAEHEPEHELEYDPVQEPELLTSIPLKRKRLHSSTTFTHAQAGQDSVSQTEVTECIYKVPTSIYVSLSPIYAANLEAGVKAQHLDPLLMTYFGAAGGIVLEYFDVKVLGPSSATLQTTGKGALESKGKLSTKPVFVWVSVQFLVWKPRVGDTMEGWLDFEAPLQINLVVLGTFLVTVKKEQMPEGWVFIRCEVTEDESSFIEPVRVQRSKGYWTDRHGTKIPNKLRFRVTSVDLGGKGGCLVEGSLINVQQQARTSVKQATTLKKLEDGVMVFEDAQFGVLSGLKGGEDESGDEI